MITISGEKSKHNQLMKPIVPGDFTFGPPLAIGIFLNEPTAGQLLSPHTSERLLWLAFICGKLGRAVNFFRSATIRQSQNSKELGRPFTNRQLNLVIATVGLLNFMNGI
jgi:hypothetical protein